MNFYDRYTDALEKVAGRAKNRKREERYAAALKSPAETGFSTIPDFMRGGRKHLTPADVHKEYLKEHKEFRPMFALHTGDALVSDYKNRHAASGEAFEHHTKNQKKFERKANSVLNRILPGGDMRSFIHSSDAMHHGSQAQAHRDNYTRLGAQMDKHRRELLELDYSLDKDKRLALANAYMKKHFS